MKERFTTEEWDLLKLLQFQVFSLVAGADGRIDRKEQAELERQVRSGDFVADPLHRSLLTDLFQEGADAYLPRTAPNRMPPTHDRVKATLRAHLSQEEYDSFLRSLFSSGVRVAEASGTGPFGVGRAVSREERSALSAFAMQYDLDLEALAAHLGIRLS